MLICNIIYLMDVKCRIIFFFDILYNVYFVKPL
jgi:hypothetical protein